MPQATIKVLRIASVKPATFLFIILIASLLASPFAVTDELEEKFLTAPRSLLLFVSIFILGILLIKLFATIIKRRSIQIRVTIVDAIILAGLFLIIIESLFRKIVMSTQVITFSCLVLVYFFIRISVARFAIDQLKKSLWLFIGFAVLSIIAVNTYILLQKTHVISPNNIYFPITGPFNNPAHCGNYLAALFPICLSSYFLFPALKKYSYSRKLAAFLLLVTFLYSVIALDGRASWVGLSGAFILLYFTKYIRVYKSFKRNRLLVFLIVAMLLVTSFFLYEYRPQSVIGRFTIWKISSEIIYDNPLWGIGYGNFGGVYAQYQSRYFSTHNNSLEVLYADVVISPFNICIQILCEQGILGFLIFSGLIIYLFKRYIFFISQKDSIEKYVGLGCFASIFEILICGQFSYPFDILPVHLILFIAMGYLEGLYFAKSHSLSERNSYFKINISPLISIIVCFLILKINYELLSFSKRQVKAYRNWAIMDYDNIDSLTILYKTLNQDVAFVNGFAEKLKLEGRNQQVIKVLNQSKNLIVSPLSYLTLAQAYAETGAEPEAEKYFIIASNLVPNRFSSKYKLLLFYYKTGQYNKAKLISEKILSMHVKVPSDAVSSIKKAVKDLMKTHQCF